MERRARRSGEESRRNGRRVSKEGQRGDVYIRRKAAKRRKGRALGLLHGKEDEEEWRGNHRRMVGE